MIYSAQRDRIFKETAIESHDSSSDDTGASSSRVFNDPSHCPPRADRLPTWEVKITLEERQLLSINAIKRGVAANKNRFHSRYTVSDLAAFLTHPGTQFVEEGYGTTIRTSNVPWESA